MRDAEKMATKRAAFVEKTWDSLDADEKAAIAAEVGFPGVDEIDWSLSWKEFFNHARYSHEEFLREIIHIIVNRYEEEPPEEFVEKTTTDAGARWNELDPEDRYKLALKAGFCDERAKELSTLAWEGLCPMVKQDLDWVLKASPEELPEAKEHTWNDIPVRDGSLIVVKGKPAVVTRVDYEGGEPVVDYLTGPGEERQWAYLDQIQAVMAPEKREASLQKAVQEVSDILRKELLGFDGGQKRVLEIIWRSYPFFDIEEIYYILQEYIGKSLASSLTDKIEAILHKALFGHLLRQPTGVHEQRPPSKKPSASEKTGCPDKWEHFIAPMIPMGGATVGGASSHGGGLEESERAWFRKVHDTLATAVKAGSSDEEIEKLVDKLALEYVKTNVGSKDHEEIKDVLMTFVGAISMAPKYATKDPFAAIGTAEGFPGQVPATGVVERKALKEGDIVGEYWISPRGKVFDAWPGNHKEFAQEIVFGKDTTVRAWTRGDAAYDDIPEKELRQYKDAIAYAKRQSSDVDGFIYWNNCGYDYLLEKGWIRNFNNVFQVYGITADKMKVIAEFLMETYGVKKGSSEYDVALIIEDSKTQKSRYIVAGDLIEEPSISTFATASYVEGSGDEENPEDDEELDEIAKKLEDKIQFMAEVSAAIAWSTPTDEMTDKYGVDVWVIATFGDATAVNGDPLDPDEATPNPPATHRATNYGGDIPTTEEEVSLESAIQSVAQDMGIPEERVQKAADHAGYKPRHGMVYTSVSGDSDVYAKESEEEPATEASGDAPAKVVPPKLDQKKRRAVNKELVEISKTFWNSMWDATAAIDSALKKEGLTTEDYMIHGEKEGRKTLDVLLGDEVVSNSMMVLSWYKHESTGRYEVNVYLS